MNFLNRSVVQQIGTLKEEWPGLVKESEFLVKVDCTKDFQRESHSMQWIKKEIATLEAMSNLGSHVVNLPQGLKYIKKET
jgi:hypothetical protein